MKASKQRATEILIAEDSPTQAELLKALLEAHGYHVIKTVNGKEALAKLQQSKPALVISDVIMPEMDGYELCKAIKSNQETQNIPVMLITTLTDPEDVIRGLECGADNFLRKPYDESYLLARVEYLLMIVELRKSQRMQVALEINLGGQHHFISAERQQILDLLVSTYEQAVQVNNELKQREKEVAHTNLVLQGMNRIAEGLNSAISEREVADTALKFALQLPGIHAGWILLRKGENSFRIAAHCGLPPALSGPAAFEGNCACRNQLLRNELTSGVNIIHCERLAKATGDTQGLCCHASIPLWLGEGRALGVMNLAGSDNQTFTEEELKILYSVGNQVAIALERAMLHEHLEQAVAERTAKLAAEIEERKRIQQEQARLVQIIDGTPDFVGSADMRGQPIFLNRAARQIIGMGAEQPITIRHLSEVHPQWAAERVIQDGIPHARAHGVWTGESALIKHDGKELPVSQMILLHSDAQGRPSFISTIMRDISLRVEAEKTVRQALNTLDAMDDAAYIIDPDTLCFSYVNAGAVRALGYSREEFRQMTPLSVKPGVSEARYREMLAPMIRGEVRTLRYTTIHRHKDGRDIPMELNYQYIALPGEKPRFIAIARDVSEQQAHLRTIKQTASQLEAANQALEHEHALLAQRVADRTLALTLSNQALEQAKAEAEDASRAKSAFLATMSHEIRTPMNGVIGMVDVLAQSKLTEHQIDLVRTIRESANALLGIIDDILDFSKIEAGRMNLERSPVSIADLAEGLCNSLVPVASRKGVELALFISPDIPEHILSDEVRLRQVLYNLLGNAIKFSAGRPGKHGRVSLRITLDNGSAPRLLMRISDNGIGMSQETMQGLFTPFTQAEISTTRRFGGTGLGLAISKRLVDMLQGDIRVESVPGSGSTFTFILPFELAPVQPVRSLPDLSGLHCLVMDNPEINAEDLRIYLTHAGATVDVSKDAASAAQLAAQQKTSVVITLAEQGKVPAALQARLSSTPDVRYLLITHGRRRRSRIEGQHAISMDGDAMRRLSLLRAVAVAAGRASPEIFHDIADPLLSNSTVAPTVAEARAQGRLILVAEDDEINQKVILHQLALLGYAAEVASNGAEALRLWHDGRYALLLTDLHMPEMDGYTLAETIRHDEAGRSRIPIVVLTANALRGEANRAFAAGMDDYLTKPVQLNLLRAVLEKWMAGNRRGDPHSAPVPAPQQPAATSAVDVSVLENLIGDDKATIREFLGNYLDAARSLADELRSALGAGDGKQLSACAHKLKSSSRAVGALSLGDLCAELENAGKTGDHAQMNASMQRFEITLAQVDQSISSLLREP